MQTANSTFDSKNVMVIDDNLAVLTVVGCMLESGGYNVLLASTAETALRLAARESLAIDLAVVDIVMPDVSGPDLVERMRAVRPDMKVLFISGFVDAEVVRVKALDRGMQFLPKPFTSDGLLESVERAMLSPVRAASAATAAAGLVQ
ncbi:MAG TPA: response regulator [Bryobacteraceae bacterium]|nr:response regulator [Bryobacteraceae bacterium]